MILSIRSESLSPSLSPASLPALTIGPLIFPTVSGRSVPGLNLSMSNIFINFSANKLAMWGKTFPIFRNIRYFCRWLELKLITKVENKYIWLVDLLRQPLTLREIQEHWKTSSLNDTGAPFDRKTFRNWKEHIAECYGVNIVTNLAGKDTTYQVEQGSENVSNWLMETISTRNALSSSLAIKDRILLEDIPSAGDSLKTVIEAMKDNRLISFEYKDYWEDSIEVTMRPYFVKLFRLHWKVIGPLEGGDLQTIRSYALDPDRMRNLRVLDGSFTYPADFSPEAAMSTCLGTTILSKELVPPRLIIILVWEKFNFYLKSVPLHHSQRILFEGRRDGYTIFSYYLQPTDDFYREICRFGEYVEVLHPIDVRTQMQTIIQGMSNEYAGLSRTACQDPVPDINTLLADCRI